MTEFPSDRISRIGASATMQMTQAARDLRAQGREVISLSAGESDFETPAHIGEAAMKAIRDGKTRYTAVDGIPELKAAICEKFSRENDLEYTPQQINVSPGGKPVIFNALAVTLNAGDQVVVPTPCWVSYPDMVRLCGAEPVLVHCGAEMNYRLTPEKLDDALGSKTKWLMLNSPSNPTGAAYSADELRALAKVLRRYPHVLILMDDIYEHLVFDDFEFATLAQVAPDLKDRVLTMNGVSKAYAMTGWRIGFAGGPEWLIKLMAKYMGQTTSNPASISQWAAVAALTGPQDFLVTARSAYAARRNKVVADLNAIEGIACRMPEGAFYAFFDVSGVLRGRSDSEFTRELLDQTGLALVPGSAFHAPSHVRLSYAASQAELDAAMAHLRIFCAD